MPPAAVVFLCSGGSGRRNMLYWERKEGRRPMMIADAHNDALLEIENPEAGLTDERKHVSLNKMKRGGVSLMTFAAFSTNPKKNGSMIHMGLDAVDRFYRMLAAHEGELVQALRPEDVYAAQKAGKPAAMLSVEGGDIIEGDIGVLRLLVRLGVRMFGLCWSLGNQICSGVADAEDTGLTDVGYEVIRECGRMGVIVDLSHASDRTTWQVLESAEKPPCASHSCARALCPDQERDLTDEMLDCFGKRGGYIGVNFCHDFLVGGGYPIDHLATIDDVVRHIEYMASRAGAEHIGLGSDYDGIGRVPVGLEDCSKLGAIYDALLRRNWKESDARGVMGENFLRYWARVQAAGESAAKG